MKSQKNVVRNQRFRHKCDCMCSFCFSAIFAKLKWEIVVFGPWSVVDILAERSQYTDPPFCSQHVLISRLLMKDQFDLSTLVSYETALWQDVHHKRSAKTEKWAGDIRRQSRYDRMVLHFRVWIHFNVFLSSTWTILSSCVYIDRKVCLGPQSIVASSGKWKSLTKTLLLSTIVYSHTVPKMTKLKKDKFFFRSSWTSAHRPRRSRLENKRH